MQALISFNNVTTDFDLTGSAVLIGAKLKLTYKLLDPKNLLALPQAFTADPEAIARVDGLWNDTCFELFLRPVGKTSYHEFNFSLLPAWNQYVFSSYRNPQPPTASHDYTLESFSWDGTNLEIMLAGFFAQKKYEVSLTAVLKEKSGLIHYLAHKHTGSEPDFHHIDSFMPLPSAGRQ